MVQVCDALYDTVITTTNLSTVHCFWRPMQAISALLQVAYCYRNSVRLSVTLQGSAKTVLVTMGS